MRFSRNKISFVFKRELGEQIHISGRKLCSGNEFLQKVESTVCGTSKTARRVSVRKTIESV